MAGNGKAPIIEVRDLVVDLKGHRILNGVTLDVYRGEILGFVGASGAGKSVLTRTIVGLLPKQQGRIDVFFLSGGQIDGHGNEPRCILMQEADGDLAVDLLGELAARMPAAPTRDTLAALCKGGG